jgi:signal peptidase I
VLSPRSGERGGSSTVVKNRILVGVTVSLGAIVFLVIITGGVRTYKNVTGGMEPTLPIGSRMVVVRSGRANRGDLVVFRYPRDERLTHVKRVAGVAGDTIEIRAKKLMVNGKTVAEPYVIHLDEAIYPDNPMLPEPYRSRDNFGPYHVPKGQLFLLGDNRDRSSDSRYYGTVGLKLVTGHPVLLYSLKRGVWRP